MKKDDENTKLTEKLEKANIRIAELEAKLLNCNEQKYSDKGHHQIQPDLDWGLLFNAIRQPIAILDKDHNVLSMNDSLKSSLHSDINGIIGTKCWEVFHKGANSPAQNCPFQSMLEEETNQTCDMVVEAFNGTYLVTCTPIFDSAGNIDKVIHIATDISEQKKLENEIKVKEQRLIELTSNIADVIWELDQQFKITFANGNVEGITGYTQEELVGRSMFDIMEPSDRLALIEKIAQLNKLTIEERLNNDRHYELRYVKKSGEIIWCEINPNYILDASNALLGFRGVLRNITNRKEIEIGKIESERRFYEIIDFLPDPTFAVDKNGVVIAWNRAIEKMTGTSKEQIIGKSNKEYAFAFYKEIRPMLIDVFLESNNEYFELYDKIEQLDENLFAEVYDSMFYSGKGAYFSAKVSPLKDKDGNIIGAIETIRDVTEMRRAENELIERKAKLDEANSMLRLILDSAPIRIFWKDINLIFRGCNNRFAKDYGLTSDADIIGLSDFDLLPKETAEAYRALDMQIIESGEAQLNLEEPPNRASSSNNWIKTSRVPLKNSDDIVIGILAIHEDITEIKKVNEDLKITSERLKMVFDATNDGIWDWDLVTNQTFFSDKYYAMLGYENNEFESNYDSWLGLIFIDDIDRSVGAVESYATGKTNSLDFEFRLKTKTGEYLWVNARGKIVQRDHKGKPLRMIGTHIDISERKAIEEKVLLLNKQLVELNSDLENIVADRTNELLKAMKSLGDSNEELQLMNEQIASDAEHIQALNNDLLKSENELKRVIAAKDKFFSLIANELKSPFSGFLLLSDLMAKDFDELSVSEMKKMARTINSSASTIYNLLESLLQWSRLQLGEIPFNLENIDLSEIVTNILFVFNKEIKAKGVEAINKVPKGTLVYCDRNMITSALRNLVSNAIKYNHKDGFVEIFLDDKKTTESMISITVKDSGKGIPENAMQKIFNYDSHYATKGTDNEQGSGLGLTLSKEFIERHKGTISITSEEGIGTEVSVHLPITFD